MGPDRFIEQRRGVWEKLERIVAQLYKRGPRHVPGETLNEMLRLYRQTTADLAHLRTAGADPAQIRQLNRLVARAHGLIYRHRPRRSTPVAASLWRFVSRTYPRLFREAMGPMLVSLLICVGTYAMAYEAVQSEPMLVASIMGGGVGEFTGEKEPEDITARFKRAKETMTSQLFSSMIMTNNIRVALTAFALGITFGIGTTYILVVNGAMVGGIAGAFARSGIEGVLWMTLLPHGALELSAIVVAGGSGLLLGRALWCPGQRTRRRALREDGVKATLLAAGLVPAFVVAGFYEGFITPSEAMPGGLKVTIGVVTAVVFWAYLLLAGHGREAAGEDELETATDEPAV